MRSFAVFAGLAAAANAYAYGYPAINSTSVAPPAYETSSAPAYPEYPSYPVSSSAPAYPAYPVSSKAPEYPSYPVSSSAAGYPVHSSVASPYPVSSASGYASYAPPAYSTKTPVVPYPSKNVSTPYPTGVKPSSTKPATPEFTGAAAQAGVGLMAVIGAVAAFL